MVVATSWFDEADGHRNVSRPRLEGGAAQLHPTIASELIGGNIRADAVSPGVIETPILGKLGLPEANVQKLAHALLRQIPVKRFGKPEEVATAVAFLASDDASHTTGVELSTDGGRAQL
jgi:NAD(P)-dependent dehydrogenase (short-subunit alcohol dehydrogenase family)